jgi:hypothetical protein
MSLMIMATYTQYQSLVNTLNTNILSDLNDNVIVNKYTIIDNAITDGDIASIKAGGLNGAWTGISNAVGVNDSAHNNTYIKMKPQNSSFKQLLTSKLPNKGNRKLLVRFDVFRNGYILCNSNSVNVAGVQLTSAMDYPDHNFDLCGEPEMWVTHQFIIEPNIGNTSEINFNVSGMRSTASYIDVNTLYIGIKNVMVVDITDVYLNAGTDDNTINEYFYENVPYFNGSYTIKKI